MKTLTAPSPIKVLLTDDDQDDFVMIRDLLAEIEGGRYSLEWAASFEEGKNKIGEQRHDVYLVDYRLGAKTGLDLLREMIATTTHAPMILLTGYGEREVDFEAMKVGASDYLVKDQVTPQVLERSIRYSINRIQHLELLRQREAQILMQDRLASIGLLASSLAHEIGTPLGVIRGRAEYLAIQVKDDPGIKKNVDVIVSQIDRVSKIIHSLLNLARGEPTSTTGNVLLNQVTSEVLDLMGHEFRRHEIEIKNELSPSASLLVRAQSGPLHQVLLNLLVNSLHAIETAKKIQKRLSEHAVRITAQETDTHWGLRVQDTGCGISAANLRNLFKPFFTTKEIGVGTGLGLANSFRIVEPWGGSFQVESQEGVGSTFTLLLPKAKS